MNRLAVLGRPIAHSLSPAMHTAAFRALGIEAEWSYEAIELSPEGFGAGVAELRERGFVGANVTVPHKQAALALADRASDAAASIGAANTLSFTAAGVLADNTDAPGLISSLPDSFDPAGRTALVLGAGGAARAAIWALTAAGTDVSIHNRTRARAVELAGELGASVLGDGDQPAVAHFDLVVNATSVGLAGDGPTTGEAGADLKALGIRADAFTDRQVVVDLVYGSSPTELLRAASSAGATVVDGLEILIGQGAESFRIWTGMEPPVEAMRAALHNPPPMNPRPGRARSAKGSRLAVPARLVPAHGFARRAYGRMLEVDGIDRAIAIGALSFTALFPMLIVYAALITRGDGFDLANRLIDRFELSGSTADTLQSAFQAPAGSSTAFVGAILVVLTALSFTRAMQRLYETCWGLERRGMRGSGWGLVWLAELIVWLALQPVLDRGLPAGIHAAASLAIAAGLWLSTPYLLLGRRIHYRTLAPGAALTAIAMTVAGYVSVIAMPEVVASSSTEFGTIGVAFALLAWLTAIAMVIMGCAVLSAELARGGWSSEPESS